MEERLIAEQDRVYAWPGPKRKSTLFSATLGRAVLTDRRLVFLSTGKHDVGKRMAIALVSTTAAQLNTSKTEHLDESALQNKGSLSIPLERIDRCELKGMFKVLVVHYRDESGAAQAVTIAPKNGGMPGGQAWIEEIDAARARTP